MQDALAPASLDVPKGGKAAAGDSLVRPDKPPQRCPVCGRATAMLEVTMLQPLLFHLLLPHRHRMADSVSSIS